MEFFLGLFLDNSINVSTDNKYYCLVNIKMQRNFIVGISKRVAFSNMLPGIHYLRKLSESPS